MIAVEGISDHLLYLRSCDATRHDEPALEQLDELRVGEMASNVVVGDPDPALMTMTEGLATSKFQYEIGRYIPRVSPVSNRFACGLHNFRKVVLGMNRNSSDPRGG